MGKLARSPDLFIAGCGLSFEQHLTSEVKEAIRRAPAVLYSRYHPGIARKLRSLNRHAVLLEQEDGEYVPFQHRADMYRRIAAKIVRVAREHQGTVSLHPGSAVVVDSITQFALRLAQRRRLQVKILPGISCVEGILAVLELEIADGIHVVLAQSLVLESGRRLPRDADCLVLQPAYYDTRFYLGAPVARRNRFEMLAKVLRRSHRPDSPAALVMLGTGKGEGPSVTWFHLRDLAEISKVISPFHSLFIPRASRMRVDQTWARVIDNVQEVLDYVEKDGSSVRQLDHSLTPAAVETGLTALLRARSRKLAGAWRTARRERGAAIRAHPLPTRRKESA